MAVGIPWKIANGGGVLQTAINAVTLALVDAGIPMNDYICATSAGLVDDNAILGISVKAMVNIQI
jgi:exosome complex component RRP41